MKVSCIILAGGNSSRMGTDKAFVYLNGKPLIAYPLELSHKIFSDIVVSVKTEEQEKKIRKLVEDVKVVIDLNNVFSPMVGIKRAVEYVRYGYVFILPCDMPFIRETTIKNVISRLRKGVDCVVYAWSPEKYEPFCAVYKKSLFYGRDAKDSMHDLIKGCKNKLFLRIKEPKVFFNVNTRDDLTLAERLIHLC